MRVTSVNLVRNLRFLKKQKTIFCTKLSLVHAIRSAWLSSNINFPTNWGPSEGSETSTDEYSARRIQIYRVFFGTLFSHVSSHVSKNERPKMDHTKIDTADLDSPCRELSNSGLGIAVALLVCRWIILCVRIPKEHSLCLGGKWHNYFNY